jgi:AraC family transcriptional regulator
MQQEKPERGIAIAPLDWLKVIPFKAAAASERLGWVGLEAARYRASTTWEYNAPALTHHRLILVTQPPQELELRFEEIKRHVPPPTGAILLVPAGTGGRVRWSGGFDWLHIYLDPALVARVAVEAFDLDPARLPVPPLDDLGLPQLRAAMWAVDAEMTSGGAGGPLAAESLANLLAVLLIRHLSAPRRPECGRDGTLPRAKLRAVVEYVEEHLDASPTLSQMAVVARLSVYHFARQFKRATGVPPYQYVITRRVERAKDLLQGGDLPLAEVAAYVGFSDQSQFSHHFKRLVGVSPGQFRTPARIA